MLIVGGCVFCTFFLNWYISYELFTPINLVLIIDCSCLSKGGLLFGCIFFVFFISFVSMEQQQQQKLFFIFFFAWHIFSSLPFHEHFLAFNVNRYFFSFLFFTNRKPVCKFFVCDFQIRVRWLKFIFFF